jgi:hypothetical protein
MSKPLNTTAAVVFAGLLCLLASCSSEEPPRTSDEIFNARSELPAVYFTFETKQKVLAPASKGVFVDEKSGEVCWLASACNNPDCPAKQADGEPFLFIAPDYGYFRKDDGTLGHDPKKAAAHKMQPEDCPECRKKRNLRSETSAQRQQYIDWVRPYVLPETTDKMKELDEELKRRKRLDRGHRVPKPTVIDPSHKPTPADPSTRPAA